MAEAKMVMIFHTGKGNGPMETAHGILSPGQSLEVSEAVAEKLTGAYKHVKLAKDVIPGGAADPRMSAENAMLKAEVAKLTKQLEDMKGAKDVKAEAPAAAEAQPEAAPAAAEAPAKKGKKA